jgi:hypothetical protein
MPVLPQACVRDLTQMLLPLQPPPFVVVKNTEDIEDLMDALGQQPARTHLMLSVMVSADAPMSATSPSRDLLLTWLAVAMLHWRRSAFELIWGRCSVMSKTMRWHQNTD